jgi:dTMP kinase
MSQPQITIKPGSFIVFEGLDATGKTTQLDRLEAGANGLVNGHELFTAKPMFTHQPSGNDALGERIYSITEEMKINSPWCRQFLHLASHANHYKNMIIPALAADIPVFMDRCWWSTFAYGYYGGEMFDEMTPLDFLRIATLPAMGRYPDAVFLFTEPYAEDRHNTELVVDGYRWLASAQSKGHLGVYGHKTHLIEMPQGTPDDITKGIVLALVETGLAA